jgi:hypothetical protein
MAGMVDAESATLSDSRSSVSRSGARDGLPTSRAGGPLAAWRELMVFRGARRPRQELWISITAFALVLGAWILATESGLVHPQILPSPRAVVEAWWRMFVDNDYIADIGVSVARVWIAFLTSAVIAIPIGMLMSGYRGVNALFEPLIDFIRYLPCAGARASDTYLARHRRGFEDHAALDRHILPAGPTDSRRCAPGAQGIH